MKNTLLAICLTILLLSCRSAKDPNGAIFPRGGRAPAANFTGTVWLHPVMSNDSTFRLVMGSVTFEPGARSNWHSHPAGQILLVTSGMCYTQERGKPLQIYRKGDVVRCLPKVEHWHGASPDSAMTHIAVNPNTENGIVTWLEPVTEEQYGSYRKR